MKMVLMCIILMTNLTRGGHDDFLDNNQYREITFVNGLKQKEMGWYIESGNVERNFSFKDGIPHGKFVGYYDDGMTKYFEENYINGLEEGTQRGWNADGTLRYEEQRAAGVKIMRMDYKKKRKWTGNGC
ncbi:MAG: antitoxin component YwqK of YwqJK toxin-antitoxin module [Paraglaciecola sp.]|jgi:antitoxin component YwqK of YwqJK toxin-antitoxin module